MLHRSLTFLFFFAAVLKKGPSKRTTPPKVMTVVLVQGPPMAISGVDRR